ncbi:hypothetical protein F5Y10DRAFT_219823 [Nemania abortiva]|nr:hypothetical protein F5Y10DRAFT_219823 [Nemania abortiva]
MPTAKGNPEFKWTGEAHEALALALARMHGTIQKDQQAAVVKDMIDGGFQTSWEGIRILRPLNFLSSSSRYPLSTLLASLASLYIIYLLLRHTITMATPTKSAKKWDEKMLAHLFVSICETLDLTFTQENKDAIVAMMKDRYGHDVNWNGIRQHLQKLKKKDGNGSAPATPTKPGIRVVKKKTPANGKKRGRPARIDLDRNDFDEDEDEKMDLKKPKLDRMEAPNFGQSFGDEPSHPEDGEV